MGFSFHITTIYQGAELPMHYKNHLEAVYCISGEGSIENCASGEVHEIQPGVLYALDKPDRHILRGRTEMVMACCFNPPATRSAERRGGKACVSTGRSRWSPYLKKKKTKH